MKSLKRTGFYFLGILIALVIMFCVGELILRLYGAPTFKPYPVDVNVQPKSDYFQADSLLGYKHVPGKFTVTLQRKYSFTTTHDTRSLRITHSNDSTHHLPEIWIMGCSYTYGWSINDKETYPWLLQQMLNKHEVVNWGCSGYGTLHFYLQLKRALQNFDKPELVVVTYAGFHNKRNTFSFARRRSVKNWSHLGTLSQPYANLDKDSNLVIEYKEQDVYPVWVLADKSSLIYYIQRKLEDFKDRNTPNEEVTRQLFTKIAELCKRENINLLFTNINDPDEFSFIKEIGQQVNVPAVDISVDLSLSKNNNRPFDTHPSKQANSLFAGNLLSKLIDKEMLVTNSLEE